jgi:hypothetical protein
VGCGAGGGAGVDFVEGRDEWLDDRVLLDDRVEAWLVPLDERDDVKPPTRADPAADTARTTCSRTTVRVGSGFGLAGAAVTVTVGVGRAASASALARALAACCCAVVSAAAPVAQPVADTTAAVRVPVSTDSVDSERSRERGVCAMR